MEKEELEYYENTEQQEQSYNEEAATSDNEVQEEIPSTSPKNATSIIGDLILLWKRIPVSLKGTILTSLGYIALFIVVAIMIVLLIASATGVAEDLWVNITNINESISSIGEKVGNFFTGAGFVTNQEEAEKNEKKYYEKLKEVSDYYQRKYNVQIDTSLITATLFYGRGMSDYIDEEDINNLENNELDDEEIYQGQADFYKLARRQIKTLAKFQIIESSSYNACIDSSSAVSKIEPESAKEIADTWTGIYGWNQQATFNNQPYKIKSYTDVEGNTQNIVWCEYQNAEDKLRPFYEKDKAIYEKRKKAHEDCLDAITSSMNNCIAGCSTLNTSNKGYESCVLACEKAASGKNCDTQKQKMDEAYDAYYSRWLSEGLFNESGGFSCTTSQWGHLKSYGDSTFIYSHLVDGTWIDREVLPNRLEVLSSPYISCSEKPAIQTKYATSIEREGVYYYKLLSRNAQFLSNKNFIEKYYPDYITDKDDDKAMEEATKIVEGIYDLYDFVVERDTRYCFTPNTSSGSYASENRSEFISMIADEVVKDMQNTGILASLTIAQAAHESANGTSKLSQAPYNNYYGMTAGSCASGVTGVQNGEVVKSKANGNDCTGNAYWNGDVVRMCNKSGADCQWYRVYDGFSNSTLDHSRLLSTSRYSCQGITDSIQAVTCIQNAGYATDPNYFNAIMSTISTYNLEQYNIGQWNGEAVGEYGSATMGTICYGTMNEIFNGDGTIPGSGAQGIRTNLWGTSEYEMFWGSDNNLFYRSSKNLVKQCTWYAHGRGLEILTKNGMSLKTAQQYLDAMHGNAGTWYNSNKYFSSSKDYLQPKVGAIIVWSKGSEPGHVAIIEDIKYDAHGNITSLTTTEGGVSINGFKYTEGRTLDWVKSHGSYKFVGYVYLLN